MLDKVKLAKLISSAEVFVGRTNGQKSNRRTVRTVDTSLAKPVLDYLVSPYEHGYWELKANWNLTSDFSLHLLQELESLKDIEREGDASPNYLVSKLSDEQRDELLKVTSRLSGIHTLFWALAKTHDGQKLPRLTSAEEWVKSINLEKLRSSFSTAFDVFMNELYCEEFATRLQAPGVCLIKSGLAIVMEGPKSHGKLLVVGTDKAVLSALMKFYQALGVLETSSLNRIFAPEDALLKPYFAMVSATLPHVIENPQQGKSFSDALDYYDKEDFQHCISTLGLIAEDQLQRIFSTLLREQVPPVGLTLGQLVDNLHKRIEGIFPTEKPVLRAVDKAFSLIKDLKDENVASEVKVILREIVQVIQEDRVYHGKRIEEITKNSSKKSPFPSQILDNLNELLKWRNAASHKSRVPLGAHEADRTLYCLVTIVVWWQEQLRKIDWLLPKTVILEGLITASKR